MWWKSSGLLIVVGDGETAISDIAEVEFQNVQCDWCAVNRAFRHRQYWDWWYSYHHDFAEKVFIPIKAVSCVPGPMVDHVELSRWKLKGSSTAMACRVAIKLGYERIILAGVPLSGRYDHFAGYWDDLVETGQVRSLSGRTKNRLGYPDKEFWHGNGS